MQWRLTESKSAMRIPETHISLNDLQKNTDMCSWEQHSAVEIPLNAEVDNAAVHKLQSPLSPLFVNVYFRTGIVCIFCPL